MGGVELIAAVTAEAARDLALTPGGTVVFSFKATAIQVF
jgi:molybdopterin-binding protein